MPSQARIQEQQQEPTQIDDVQLPEHGQAAIDIAREAPPEISQEVLNQLLYHRDPSVQIEILNNHQVQIEAYILGDLSDHSDSGVRLAVINRPEITDEQFVREFELESDLLVRASMLELDKTPGQLLERYSQSGAVELRAAVARNPNLPQHLVSQLAFDKAPGVRLDLVRNSSVVLDDFLLGKLSADSDDQVRTALIVRSELLTEQVVQMIRNESSEAALIQMLQKHTVPSSLLSEYATRGNAEIKAAVAHNPALPTNVALYLLQKGSLAAVRALAEHTQDPQVASVLLENPKYLENVQQAVTDAAYQRIAQRLKQLAEGKE